MNRNTFTNNKVIKDTVILCKFGNHRIVSRILANGKLPWEVYPEQVVFYLFLDLLW